MSNDIKISKDERIEELEQQVRRLRDQTQYLESRLITLEDKID